MAVESAADLASFFDATEFATSALYTPAVGVPSTVVGIFDAEFAAVDLQAGVEVESTRPQFMCRTADVAAAAHGETLVIGAITYTIRGAHPDGTGVTTLILEKP